MGGSLASPAFWMLAILEIKLVRRWLDAGWWVCADTLCMHSIRPGRDGGRFLASFVSSTWVSRGEIPRKQSWLEGIFPSRDGWRSCSSHSAGWRFHGSLMVGVLSGKVCGHSGSAGPEDTNHAGLSWKGQCGLSRCFCFPASFRFFADKEKIKRSAESVCGLGSGREMWGPSDDEGCVGRQRSVRPMADKRVILARCRAGWTEDEAWA